MSRPQSSIKACKETKPGADTNHTHYIIDPPYRLYFIDILSVLIQMLNPRENRTTRVAGVEIYQFTLPTEEMYTSSIEARRWPTLTWQFLACPRYVKYPLRNSASADCCLVGSAPRWLSGDGGLHARAAVRPLCKTAKRAFVRYIVMSKPSFYWYSKIDLRAYVCSLDSALTTVL